MKKIILSLVFIFTTIPLMNANSTNKEVDNDYCMEQMYDVYEFMIVFTGDVQLASDTAEGIFNECEKNTDEIPGYYN